MRADGHWTYWSPAGALLPEQGWKIHVSAIPKVADNTLRLVSAYCRQHRLPFKHLRDHDTHAAVNAKDADRASAGKFITVYPADEAALRTALTELDCLVGGAPGPYVLSDLRWNRGPLSVRYGGFAALWTRDEVGARVPAIRDPQGALHEDRRTAGFLVPGWVQLPDFLEAQREALGTGTAPDDFPYEITRALHHSNAGGVYAATHRSGRRVVLKEARPCTGFTPDGRDAVARLRDEESSLCELAGADVVAVYDSFMLHDHFFLALDHVDGGTLAAEVVARSPLIRAAATDAERGDYRDWALQVTGRVREAVNRIHAVGRTHGDLHPGNVVVGPDGRVTLLDLEMSTTVQAASGQHVGAPGFIAADGRAGTAADAYALACLELFVFVPLTTLFPLDPTKAEHHIVFACEAFALDDDWAERIRGGLDLTRPVQVSGLARRVDAVIRTWPARDEDGALGVQVMIARALQAGADYSRHDRVWPGDPRQFVDGGYGLAYGAAGVIHALSVSGLDVDPLAAEWLDDAVQAELDAPEPARIGLYDGIAGAGWLSRRLGNHSMAEQVLARVRTLDLDGVGTDLYGGLAGIGLYLLSEAGERPRLVGEASEIATALRTALDAHPPVSVGERPASVPTGRGGLMWGPSGTAAFAARLYELTGDAGHLSLAVDAVERDLAACATASDGSLQLNEGWRLMPYLATGSAGVGLVIVDLLRHVPDPSPYESALEGIRAAASVPFTIESGLFDGRSGMIHLLTELARAGLSTPQSDAALAAHIDALAVHAMHYRHGIAFPGSSLLKLSFDLATGSAGVLTALQAYTMLSHDEARPGWEGLLPLVGPQPAPAVRPVPAEKSPRPQLQGRR